MSSVYVKNMKMPNCCGDCFVGFCKQIGCDMYIGYDDYSIRRHPDCPLTNVGPHGRLIDASKCEPYFYEHFDDLHIKIALYTIDDMPTIIEAEEE